MRNALLAAAAVVAFAPAALAQEGEGFAITAPAGTYTLDQGHAALIWKVNHLGLSNYTGRFDEFDATIEFDPANPGASSVTATINPAAVSTSYGGDYKAGHADSGFETWDEDVARNTNLLNADNFPEITFASTGIEVTGDNTGVITGDLTFLGVTQPVSLDVTMNGELNPHPFGLPPAIGFSATGTVDRSAFGNSFLVPNISAEVEIQIEAEFFHQAEDAE